MKLVNIIHISVEKRCTEEFDTGLFFTEVTPPQPYGCPPDPINMEKACRLIHILITEFRERYFDIDDNLKENSTFVAFHLESEKVLRLVKKAIDGYNNAVSELRIRSMTIDSLQGEVEKAQSSLKAFQDMTAWELVKLAMTRLIK